MRPVASRSDEDDATDALRRWLEGHDGALEEWLAAGLRDRPRPRARTGRP